MDSRSNEKVDIFSYEDFRSFLRDYYKERRSKDRKFSIRFFARRAGLKSQNYLKVVMDGRRSLTARNLPKFIKGLGLAGSQAEYFEALVNLNQARDEQEKKFYMGRIEHLQKKKVAHQLNDDQLELFSNWRHMVILEMACQENFEMNPEKISRRLRGRVSPKEVQQSLEFLFKSGLLRFEISGQIRPIAAKIASPDQVQPQVKRALHQAFTELALETLKEERVNEDDFRSLTIGLAPEQVPAFKQKLQDFQREMNTLFSNGKGVDVYQLNLQFFKLTKNT